MKLTTISVLAMALAALPGCGTTTAERVGSGAAVGAASGALVGSMTANPGKGALIGAGAGALGGLLIDQGTNQTNRTYNRNQ